MRISARKRGGGTDENCMIHVTHIALYNYTGEEDGGYGIKAKLPDVGIIVTSF